jgi:hypothetical protein
MVDELDGRKFEYIDCVRLKELLVEDCGEERHPSENYCCQMPCKACMASIKNEYKCD